MKLKYFILFASALILPAQFVGATVRQASKTSISPSAAVNAALVCINVIQNETKPTKPLGWSLVDSEKKKELVDSLELALTDILYEKSGVYLGYNPTSQYKGVSVCEISSEKFIIPEFNSREYNILWRNFNEKFGANSPRQWPDSTWKFQNLFVNLILVTPDSNSSEINKKSIHNSLIYITITPVKATK